MTWWRGLIFFFQRNDRVKVTMWWQGRNFYQEKNTKNFMISWFRKAYIPEKSAQISLIWCLERSLFQREKIQRTLWSDDLENFFSREKIQETLWSDDLEKKFNMKRNDTENFMIGLLGRSLCPREKILENFMIWWLGRSLFSREEILNALGSDDLEKLIFNRKDSEILLIWCLGKSLFPREKIQKINDLKIWKIFFSRERLQRTLCSDDLEEAYFQVRRCSKRFSTDDIDGAFFQEKKRYWKLYDPMLLNNLFFKRNDTEKVTIWWLGWIFFEEKNTKKFMISCFGKAYIQEKKYWIVSDFMSWKKLFSKRKDAENATIWRFGKSSFSTEKIRKILYSDDLEKKFILQRKDTENFMVRWIGRSLFQEK